MSDSFANIDSTEFERLVRDALANLYDQAALSRHPFAGWLDRDPAQSQTRGQQLRELLIRSIERLHPADREQRPGSPEWRPYLLLRSRFIDGASQRDLQELLGLSERQLRRDQARAIQALSEQVWDALFPGQSAPWQQQPPERPADEEEPGSYAPAAKPLDVSQLLEGVVDTLKRRAEDEGVLIDLRLTSPGREVLADRIVLRQVLLSLLSYALDARAGDAVVVTIKPYGVRLEIHVEFEEAQSVLTRADKGLQQARFWAGKTGATLAVTSPSGEVKQANASKTRLSLSLPVSDQPVLLVVDDQATALRMFQRYLAREDLRLVGVHDGAEAVAMARRLLPRAIMLDIMMPNLDGWEVLQGLQADPETARIPVIVCSVWEDPELAVSLGAADFLKKPITQSALLAALNRLQLLGSGAGQR